MAAKKPFLKSMRSSSLSLALVGGLFLNTGCTTMFLDTAANGIFVQEEVNFSEKNYAAADYLIQQAKSYISRYAHIEARPLTDVQQPDMGSTFSKMVPEQIGIRLSQLGYQVNLGRVATAEDTNYLKPSDESLSKSGDFILSGSFMRNRTDMDISMRIIDAENNQVIAVFDYKLPLTREVAELAKPKPKIIRLDSSAY